MNTDRINEARDAAVEAIARCFQLVDFDGKDIWGLFSEGDKHYLAEAESLLLSRLLVKEARRLANLREFEEAE